MTTQPVVMKVASLNQGISKQAASLRFPSQVADAENTDFTVVDGARKRPGGETIAKCAGGVQSNATYRMHRIERDDDEEYAIVYGPKASSFFFRIVHLGTGEVVTPTGISAVQEYLTSSGSTVDDLRFITVADTTFVVNTKKPTAVSADDDGSIDNTTMPITLVRTATSPLAFALSTAEFSPRGFYQQVLNSQGQATGANFRLRYLPGSVNYTTANIPYNASAEEVQVALQGDGTSANEGLPPFPFGKVICTGGPLPEQDIFINISTDLEIEKLLTVSTQPAGANYRVLRGSPDRDPAPEFIRKNLPIRDISFFRNRLVLASDEFLAFSRSDDTFGFFLSAPLAVTAADPIEIQISATDVNIIENVTPFRNTLVVLTKSGRQFELTSEGVFSSETAAITQSTAYDTQVARPAAIGNRLYMAGTNDSFSSFLEYYYEDSFATNTARVVSEHVDTLIPANIKRIAACSTNDQVIVFPAITGDIIGGGTKISLLDGSGDEDGSDEYDEAATWQNNDRPIQGDNAIITDGHTVTFDGFYDENALVQFENPSGIVSELYVYRTRFNGTERVQGAWTRWTFGGDALMDIFVIDDQLYVLRRQTSLVDSETRLKLDKINLGGSRSPDFAGFSRDVHMDHMIQKTGTASDGVTTITLSAEDADRSRDVAVDNAGNEYPLTQSASGNQVTINSEIGTAVVLGRKFDMNLELGELYMKTPQNQPIEGGRMSIKKMITTHTESGPYEVEIDSTLSSFVPTRTTSKTSSTIESGRLSVPMFGQPRDLTVTVKSTNSFPVTITSLEYHGTHSTNLE